MRKTPKISRKVFEGARNSHNYVRGLKSMFDFNGMVALAGMCSFSDFFVNIFLNVVILNCLTQCADRTFNE